MLRREGWSVLPTPRCSHSGLPLQSDPSILWPAASHVFLMLFLQEFSILLPPFPLLSHCWNPFLARPEVPFLCALQVSEDKETLILYHHLLHFLQLPGCFHHDILVQPLSNFSCCKRTHWIGRRVLFVIFFSLWRSHFIAKIISPIPVFFSPYFASSESAFLTLFKASLLVITLSYELSLPLLDITLWNFCLTDTNSVFDVNCKFLLATLGTSVENKVAWEMPCLELRPFTVFSVMCRVCRPRRVIQATSRRFQKAFSVITFFSLVFFLARP